MFIFFSHMQSNDLSFILQKNNEEFNSSLCFNYFFSLFSLFEQSEEIAAVAAATH